MFKEVMFECDATQNGVEEAEYHGYMDKGTSIVSLDSILKWMESVNASQNAKYLKCLNGLTSGITVMSITDIKFSADLVAKGAPTSNNVVVSFVEEGPNAPAMEVSKAYELFTKIAELCAERGIDTKQVGVYTQNKSGRLTRQSFYYDDDSDTAVLVKNIPWQLASEFLKGAEITVVRVASTPKTVDKYIDELASIEEKIKALQAKKDSVYAKMEKLPSEA